jgi:ribosomal protein S18 acetylase RimI-like enzyme
MSNAQEQIRARITLRPVTLPDDEAFLQELYASTRVDLDEVLSDKAQLRQLLIIQYNGQKATYSAEFPNAEDQIVLFDGEPVGRLMLDHRPGSIHGVDIAVLKEARNQGVGTGVLMAIFEECSATGSLFTISVLRSNPAMRLYERLGFVVDGGSDTHFSMTWRPKKT